MRDPLALLTRMVIEVCNLANMNYMWAAVFPHAILESFYLSVSRGPSFLALDGSGPTAVHGTASIRPTTIDYRVTVVAAEP